MSRYHGEQVLVVPRAAFEEAGISLPVSKKTLVYSRLSRRLRELGYHSFHAYLDFVKTPAGQAEMEKLICALTTNVTSFFREKKHFEHLEAEVLPHLARATSSATRPIIRRCCVQ